MAKKRASYPISKRAVLIGILLIVINTYWLAYAEMLWHTAHLTTVALSINLLFTLLIITWLAWLFGELWRGQNSVNRRCS